MLPYFKLFARSASHFNKQNAPKTVISKEEKEDSSSPSKTSFDSSFLRIDKAAGDLLNKEALFLDHAMGCMVGAFLGDSVGSYLEFNPNPSPKLVEEALTMPGGGPFRLDAGQLTDDSELALGQAYGLIEGKGKLSLDHIAKYYGMWYNSPPFDIGRTTQNAFSLLWELDPGAKDQAKLCLQSSRLMNQDSESNGSLMRMTPLAIWCSSLSESDIEKAVRAETNLTHPSETVHEAGITYCLVIQHLLRNPYDMDGAFSRVEEYLQRQSKSQVRHWLHEVSSEILPPANVSIGWVKIGWSYSMHFLKRRSNNFRDVIKEMISKGGDTDTNACIVGGLLGAAVGLSRLPKDWVAIAHHLDVSRENAFCPRNKMYNPSNAWKVVPELLKIRPTKLEINGYDEE